MRRKKCKEKHPHASPELVLASGVDRCQRTEWLSKGESVCVWHFETAYAWTLVKRLDRCLWGGRVKRFRFTPLRPKNAVVMYLLSIVETTPGSRGRYHFSIEMLPVVITETTRAPQMRRTCQPRY